MLGSNSKVGGSSKHYNSEQISCSLLRLSLRPENRVDLKFPCILFVLFGVLRLEPRVVVLSIKQDVSNPLHQQILVGVDFKRVLDDVEPLGSESIENK